MAIRVLVADDQAMIRGALAGLLDLESDIEVVAQASDGARALEELARLASADTPARASAPVDVAIIDIEMPRMDGITATQAIHSRFPGVRVLIVSTFGRPGYLQRALDAGATGFMVKDAPVEALAHGVRTVAACAAIIHWDNYVPFGSFVAVADQFRDGENLRGTLYALSILLNIALFVPLGALAETTWRIRRMRRAPEGAPADGSRLARSIPHRRVLAWVVIGCALSCLIELTQYTGLFGVVPCTYRVVDIDDVIMNTLGTYAGVRLLPFMARNSRFMGA